MQPKNRLLIQFGFCDSNLRIISNHSLHLQLDQGRLGTDQGPLWLAQRPSRMEKRPPWLDQGLLRIDKGPPRAAQQLPGSRGHRLQMRLPSCPVCRALSSGHIGFYRIRKCYEFAKVSQCVRGACCALRRLQIWNLQRTSDHA